jgi:glycosyltransferase involved in cell wall biosynthesis
VGRAEDATFDLIVATVERDDELDRLFESLYRQTHRAFRVIVVDQNDDRRLEPVIATHPALDLLHLRAPRGLSRARNIALGHVQADLAAFPDDDCVYADDLLARVARAFTADPTLDGLTGRATDGRGRSSPSWPTDASTLTRDNVWNRAISFTMFLRAGLVARVGRFDESLGLGAGTTSTSGEEIDFLIRALALGARIEYDPTLTVAHDEKPQTAGSLRALGSRDGASVGVMLRKHDYPAQAVVPMLLRPVGGAVLALGRRDVVRARFHAATAAGRVRGYLRRSSSKT